MIKKLQSAGYLPLKVATITALPALLLLDTGIAILRGWPVNRLDLLVLVCAILPLGVLMLLVSIPTGRTLLHKHGLPLAYLSFSALIAWPGAEAIASIYLLHYPVQTLPHVHRRLPGRQWLFRIDSVLMPGISADSRYTTNSRGIRGPEFPPRDAAYRILGIGGSTTESTHLDDDETWLHLVMEKLNHGDRAKDVWVGNIGISGWPTVNHLQFVERSPLMRQIDCLLVLVGANDLNQFLRGNLVNGKFLGNESVARAQPIWRRSSILMLIRERWYRRLESPVAEGAAGENYRRRRLERQQSPIRDMLPDLKQALRGYKGRLQWIVEHSRRKGVQVVFITQPTMWDKNLSADARALLWLGDTKDGRFISVEAGREGIDKYNETLLATCEEMGVPCIDTRSMHGQEQYYYDDFHFTEAGARELARLVANGLEQVPGCHG